MVELIREGFIPLDKSWIIRMGMLDLINNYPNIREFLKNAQNLSDDLVSLRKVAEDWNTPNALDVGESGTLYRFIKFFHWKNNLDRVIVRRGTLMRREICNNPEIVNWSLRQLLTLDSQTSQWASASILFGNNELVQNPPAKLRLTYEALNHWHAQRDKGLSWNPRYDKTIERQAAAFLNALKTGTIDFVPEHSEDYCFARAFNLITKKDGEKRFPSLIGHESNRLEEMEIELENLKKNKPLFSPDHRVIQAITMLKQVKYPQKELIVQNPSAVSKSWPQFWEFMKYSERL